MNPSASPRNRSRRMSRPEAMTGCAAMARHWYRSGAGDSMAAALIPFLPSFAGEVPSSYEGGGVMGDRLVVAHDPSSRCAGTSPSRIRDGEEQCLAGGAAPDFLDLLRQRLHAVRLGDELNVSLQRPLADQRAFEIARREQHFQAGPQLGGLLGERPAGEVTRHDDVGEQEVD